MMTSTARGVDYDRIAHVYDEPGRDYEADANLVQFLEDHPRSALSTVRILDMGCGTGKQLAADHQRLPGLRMIGLDLFRGMLQQAQRRTDTVNWVQADSLRPPFPANTFDYVTNQFSYHHVRDKAPMFAEVLRVLKPGGRFAITNLDPWSMSGWIVYAYFPASWQGDLADFLPVDQLTSMMAQIGFHNIRAWRQSKRSEENLGDFLTYASQRYRTSHLMAIEDRDYEDGLHRIRRSIAQWGDQARVASEICLVWVTGDKPA